MNKKLAIFGFTAIWVASLAAIVFLVLPKFFSTYTGTETNVRIQNDLNVLSETNEDDPFFYDKKVFVRHNKNYDGNSLAQAELTITRKNFFFKPPILKIKPSIKTLLFYKKVNNKDFDIKPVPSN